MKHILGALALSAILVAPHADAKSKAEGFCEAQGRFMGVIVEMRDHHKSVFDVYQQFDNLDGMTRTEAAYWGGQTAYVFDNPQVDRATATAAVYRGCMLGMTRPQLPTPPM